MIDVSLALTIFKILSSHIFHQDGAQVIQTLFTYQCYSPSKIYAWVVCPFYSLIFGM